MRLNDAVHDVTGEIFRDGWSRIRGSMQGLQASRQRQLVRAAAGHRPPECERSRNVRAISDR